MENKFEKEYLTPEDLTDMLNIGRSKAYAVFNDPEFPAYKIGRHLYTTQHEFDEWFASKKVKKEVRRYGKLQ
jgi:predicted DNA-binding transcriptional regulator AlpA